MCYNKLKKRGCIVMAGNTGVYAQYAKICQGIDMYLIVYKGSYSQIRRYPWDKKKNKHTKGEFIDFINKSKKYDQLFELRINALERNQNEMSSM